MSNKQKRISDKFCWHNRASKKDERGKKKIDWKENEKIIQFLKQKAFATKYIFIERQNIGKMEKKLNSFSLELRWGEKDKEEGRLWLIPSYLYRYIHTAAAARCWEHSISGRALIVVGVRVFASRPKETVDGLEPWKQSHIITSQS